MPDARSRGFEEKEDHSDILAKFGTLLHKHRRTLTVPEVAIGIAKCWEHSNRGVRPDSGSADVPSVPRDLAFKDERRQRASKFYGFALAPIVQIPCSPKPASGNEYGSPYGGGGSFHLGLPGLSSEVALCEFEAHIAGCTRRAMPKVLLMIQCRLPAKPRWY